MGPVQREYQQEEGEYKERVKEGKYGDCVLYSCMIFLIHV
jgi:hypothetical protein